MVLLENSHPKKSPKLAPKWIGPYQIIAVLSPLVYKIKNRNNNRDIQTVNIKRLKKYYDSDPLEEDEFVVEKIINKRTKNGEVNYLVKFKGFSHRFNKWLPKKNLNCDKLIKKYEETRKGEM